MLEVAKGINSLINTIENRKRKNIMDRYKDPTEYELFIGRTFASKVNEFFTKHEKTFHNVKTEEIKNLINEFRQDNYGFHKNKLDIIYLGMVASTIALTNIQERQDEETNYLPLPELVYGTIFYRLRNVQQTLEAYFEGTLN